MAFLLHEITAERRFFFGVSMQKNRKSRKNNQHNYMKVLEIAAIVLSIALSISELIQRFMPT